MAEQAISENTVEPQDVPSKELDKLFDGWLEDSQKEIDALSGANFEEFSKGVIEKLKEQLNDVCTIMKSIYMVLDGVPKGTDVLKMFEGNNKLFEIVADRFDTFGWAIFTSMIILADLNGKPMSIKKRKEVSEILGIYFDGALKH